MVTGQNAIKTDDKTDRRQDAITAISAIRQNRATKQTTNPNPVPTAAHRPLARTNLAISEKNRRAL